MNIKLSKNLKYVTVASFTLWVIAVSQVAQAEAEWVSVTMDNDTFVGNDNGYTNGIYVSWWDGPKGEEKAKPGFLARAMLWSMPGDVSSENNVVIKTIGQTMITPDDIEQDPPILPPDDLPYGGLLFYSDNFFQVHDNYADRIAVTIGVVGEYSFAEESQEFVHEVISSDEPCCWDSQLDDEIVFQFSRGRVWKTWVADSGNADLSLGADISLGTISSSVGAGFMIRYGRGLRYSYASTLLVSSRTSNPVASRNGWFVFAGTRAGYLGNQIFLDGNTFDDDDDESIDYDRETLMVTAGLAYSWKEVSFTFAINDLNANETDSDAADEYSEFGTFTIAWKLD